MKSHLRSYWWSRLPTFYWWHRLERWSRWRIQEDTSKTATAWEMTWIGDSKRMPSKNCYGWKMAMMEDSMRMPPKLQLERWSTKTAKVWKMARRGDSWRMSRKVHLKGGWTGAMADFAWNTEDSTRMPPKLGTPAWEMARRGDSWRMPRKVHLTASKWLPGHLRQQGHISQMHCRGISTTMERTTVQWEKNIYMLQLHSYTPIMHWKVPQWRRIHAGWSQMHCRGISTTMQWEEKYDAVRCVAAMRWRRIHAGWS